MREYDHKKIEKVWQEEWEKTGIYKAKDKSKKKKFFPLVEFPFPSGAGLHTGHIRSYTAMDIIARKHRMQGENVLYPMGWDAFGLPTEQYAIKTGTHPQIVTKDNTDNFRRQLKAMGFSFDWSREINTTDPAYYRFTQWIFLQMFKRGLAYQAETSVWWCEALGTVLANEEVIDGKSERGDFPCERMSLSQWMLAITQYADRLDADLDTVDYLEKIKIQQRNWIGKSEGAEIDFKIEGGSEIVKVFTTRPDTLFGVTYVVLAPEHTLVSKLSARNKTEVSQYIEAAKKKDDIERTDAKKEKTGVKLEGVFALNPANGEKVPVFVADYVLAQYGTGAVMAVPAHDVRDFAFAKKYNLPIKKVIIPRYIDAKNPHVPGKQIIFRKSVLGIVRNPRTGKYLCLKWKKQPWVTFVNGGIDGDEDPVEAARREVFEETGYSNLKLIKVLDGPVQTEFFAAHKDANRISHSWYVLFDLETEVHSELAPEEAELHELTWLDFKDLTKEVMTHAEIDFILDQMKSGEKAYEGDGVLVNSGEFSGALSEEAKKSITMFAQGSWVKKFKLRDWVFSRQRYWGEPFPIVWVSKESYEAACALGALECIPQKPVFRIRDGVHEYALPLPESELPLELPMVSSFAPAGDGKSALGTATEWVNVWFNIKNGKTIPLSEKPKGTDWVKATRETDTMPNWAGSSWYFLRYIDPKNKKKIGDSDKLAHWLPTDWYNGGMEHTTLHLLYSRFWHKFLFDIGVVSTAEPYQKRTSQGMILAEGGEKMSKSKGNVINPDEIIETYGADTLRLYEMFMGPFDQAIAWDTKSLIGPRRFIERVYALSEKVSVKGTLTTKTETLLQKTIQKVTADIEAMNFNTAVSSLMILSNAFGEESLIPKRSFEVFIKLLAPFIPHMAESMWKELGNKKSIHSAEWPLVDESKITEEEVTIAIQVNGKVRATFQAIKGLDSEALKKIALAMPEIKKWIGDTDPLKVIIVPDRMVSIVIKH